MNSPERIERNDTRDSASEGPTGKKNESIKARSLGSGPLQTLSRHSKRSSDDEFSEASNNELRRGSKRMEFAERSRDRSVNMSNMSNMSLLEQLSSHHRVEEEEEELTLSLMIRRLRLFCGKIVEEPRVQLFIIVLIIANAILMGVATFDFVTDDPEIDDVFDKADRAFLVVFTVELALQLIYRSITFFTDSWLIFDLIIVVISWSMESLQIVRAFRIFRAFRLVTRIGSIRELVMALGAVMPRMYAIVMLLFLIFYIFAVLFTELFGEIELSDNYFGSLDVSLFTCMEMMTLEWSNVTREVMDEKRWAWAPVLAFISITGFIVFNLIVAVVCDAVSVVDREAFSEKHPDILTDKQKLEEAQERIWELAETVEILMMRQERLLSVTDTLTKEVRSVVLSSPGAVLAAPTPPFRSAMKNSTETCSIPSAEVLHFSDSEGEEKKGGTSKPLADDDLSEFNDSSANLENDVHRAIERITHGALSSDSSRTPSPQLVNGGVPSKSSKTQGRSRGGTQLGRGSRQ